MASKGAFMADADRTSMVIGRQCTAGIEARQRAGPGEVGGRKWVPWHTDQMATPAVDVERLTRDEQLELLDKLWDSLGRDPEALPLSEEQKRDLDLRLDELEREGPNGLSWDEALEQIRSKSR